MHLYYVRYLALLVSATVELWLLLLFDHLFSLNCSSNKTKAFCLFWLCSEAIFLHPCSFRFAPAHERCMFHLNFDCAWFRTHRVFQRNLVCGAFSLFICVSPSIVFVCIWLFSLNYDYEKYDAPKRVDQLCYCAIACNFNLIT